jgi:hypothetical protein
MSLRLKVVSLTPLRFARRNLAFFRNRAVFDLPVHHLSASPKKRAL